MPGIWISVHPFRPTECLSTHGPPRATGLAARCPPRGQRAWQSLTIRVMPYHIQVMLAETDEYHTVLDKDEDWIREHLSNPRREGRAILFHGKVMQWSKIHEIHIVYTPKPTTAYEIFRRAARARVDLGLYQPLSQNPDLYGVASDVTNRYIAGSPGVHVSDAHASDQSGEDLASDRRSVMVIYGHDSEANDALFSWLRCIGLQPQEWNQLIHLSGSTSPYVGQTLEKAFENVQAVVALFTPDEEVRERDGLRGNARTPGRFQARPNVLVEAGMALVTHPRRTIFVILGPQELPSDLAGRYYIKLDGTPGPLNELAGRLADAGCAVDRTGTRWLDPGIFPNRSQITVSLPAYPEP